jgi:hypothetical protein
MYDIIINKEHLTHQGIIKIKRYNKNLNRLEK